jgi:hypothetical protein
MDLGDIINEFLEEVRPNLLEGDDWADHLEALSTHPIAKETVVPEGEVIRIHLGIGLHVGHRECFLSQGLVGLH